MTSRALADARIALNKVGMVIAYGEPSAARGEYRVNFRGGTEATAYYSDDLTDAVATGLAMYSTGVTPARKEPSAFALVSATWIGDRSPEVEISLYTTLALAQADFIKIHEYSDDPSHPEEAAILATLRASQWRQVDGRWLLMTPADAPFAQGMWIEEIVIQGV